MDDYSLVSLSDSRNEWCARLINTLTPCIVEGLKSIFDESWKLCVENEEEDKYLMTFQTFLSRIPKWNPEIIENEKKRIEDTSSCGYLEELITCVHVIHLKALTCVRVGQKQKKVDIDIPSVDTFIHKTYCNVARKLYTSIYLFEKNLMPLEIQKHNRELEVIIRECILNTVRDTMPIENILRAYMDETEELDVNEEIVVLDNKVTSESASNADVPVEKDKPLEIKPALPASLTLEKANPKTEAPSVPITEAPSVPITEAPSVTPITDPSSKVKTSELLPMVEIDTTSKVENKDAVNFKDTDNAIDINGNTSTIHAPKTDERLEEIASLSAERRRKEEEEEEEEEKLKIGGSVSLDITDINDLNQPVKIETAPILNDIEVLA